MLVERDAQGLSSEAIPIMKKPGKSIIYDHPFILINSLQDLKVVENDLKKLYNEGSRSLAIVRVLVHPSFPEHEWLVGNSYIRSASSMSRNPHSYCR